MTTRYNLPRRLLGVASYVETDPVSYRDAGVIDSAVISFPPEVEDYRATALGGDACLEYVGNRTKNVPQGTLTIGFMSSEAENLAMAFMGSLSTDPGGTAIADTFGTVVAGDIVALSALPDPSTIVLSDSDTGPTELVEGVNWEWHAKKAGRILILDITALVEPIKAVGDSVAQKSFAPASDLGQYWMMDFAGADEAAGCVAEAETLYRVEVTEEVSRALHVAAEQRTPVPMEVTFTLDRDPARAYEFGTFAIADAAA